MEAVSTFGHVLESSRLLLPTGSPQAVHARHAVVGIMPICLHLIGRTLSTVRPWRLSVRFIFGTGENGQNPKEVNKGNVETSEGFGTGESNQKTVRAAGFEPPSLAG